MNNILTLAQRAPKLESCRQGCNADAPPIKNLNAALREKCRFILISPNLPFVWCKCAVDKKKIKCRDRD